MTNLRHLAALTLLWYFLVPRAVGPRPD